MNETRKMSYVSVGMDGNGVADAIRTGLIGPDIDHVFRAKGTITKAGHALEEDVCSLYFDSLEIALDFVETLLSIQTIEEIVVHVYFPAAPQGNWCFSLMEVKRLASIGAALNITALLE